MKGLNDLLARKTDSSTTRCTFIQTTVDVNKPKPTLTLIQEEHLAQDLQSG